MKALSFAGIVFLAQAHPVAANSDRWLEFSKEAQAAYDSGKYRKAEHLWLKAVKEADRSEVGDENLALSHKRLGEVYIVEKKYRQAEEHLRRAVKIGNEAKLDDPEAIRDLLELAKTFRTVNLEQFGKNIALILKQSGLEGIEITNSKNGNSRIVVRFADKFSKHITSPDVNQVNVDKKLTFDIHEAEDGTITLTNIKGLRVRSKFWINLKQSSITPNGGSGKPMALITAEKLGLTKTVETVLPKPVYERIYSVVERIRHPELHSPWHKQLQERVNPPSAVTTTVKAKVNNVPITIKQDSGKPVEEASRVDAEKTDEQPNEPQAPRSGQEANKTVRAKADPGKAAEELNKLESSKKSEEANKADPGKH
jgi:tetratricopeptide (TPR) repeat protein